jgi:hypothetical protein
MTGPEKYQMCKLLANLAAFNPTGFGSMLYVVRMFKCANQSSFGQPISDCPFAKLLDQLDHPSYYAVFSNIYEWFEVRGVEGSRQLAQLFEKVMEGMLEDREKLCGVLEQCDKQRIVPFQHVHFQEDGSFARLRMAMGLCFI